MRMSAAPNAIPAFSMTMKENRTNYDYLLSVHGDF